MVDTMSIHISKEFMSNTEKLLCIGLITALIAVTATIGLSEFSIKDATLAFGDSNEYQTLRQGLLPLLCSFFIILCTAVLLSLDALRLFHKRRTRGLIIIALFGYDAIFFSFIQADIFTLFFRNRQFFLILEEVSYILMPVILSGFFFRGFKIHFPATIRIIFYISVALSLSSLIMFPYWDKYNRFILILNFFWQIFIIPLLMYLLFFWKKQNPQNRNIFFDELALSCLLVSVLASGARYSLNNYSFLNVLQIICISGYFIFVVLQHVQIIIAEYRYREKQRTKLLKEQNLNLLIANRDAEQAKLEAIRANETKSRFLANMSHEIRTPINAILGMDEIIIREDKDPNIREYAMDIYSAGRTLLSIINDILDFSKIESGKMEINPVEYDFSRMIIDLSNVISPRVDAKGLRFITEIDESIPRRLYGDDLRLRQCVTNLLTNGVKYTESGFVSLIVTSNIVSDNVILHFEVQDTGMGIKEEDLPKLFHAYERIEENRNRNIEGTGLGMNITSELLELMGAELKVSSTYGKGSTFSFDVEQKIIDKTPVGKTYLLHDTLPYEIAVANTFVAPDARILVTDDNAINRKVFIRLLAGHNMIIDEAKSGFEAIDKSNITPYDIIFMDHMMPHMDGIEAMQRIKEAQDSPNANTPIYALTANAITGAKKMYLEAGFDGFLSKPIITSKLEEMLKQTLPPEKLIPVSDDDIARTSADKNTMPEDLPFVEGLDWNYAWQHLPQTDLLEKTIQEFYELIHVQSNKLDRIYDNLTQEGMLDEYRIQVHGMKSLAATVGIIPLAGSAKILEFAAKDNKPDIIRNMHRIFIDEWNSYSQKLDGVMGITNDIPGSENLEEAKYRLTLARLEMLRQAMDEYDIDRGDEIIKELLNYRYPDEIFQIITGLKEAVADIDSERVSSLVDSIIEKGEW